MKWARRSSHSIFCGELIISRATVQGRDMYTLWRGAQRVGDHDSAAQAKAAAKEVAE